ncbi:MAG: hypothetical protein ACOCP8_04855 [archaeon]
MKQDISNYLIQDNIKINEINFIKEYLLIPYLSKFRKIIKKLKILN